MKKNEIISTDDLLKIIKHYKELSENLQYKLDITLSTYEEKNLIINYLQSKIHRLNGDPIYYLHTCVSSHKIADTVELRLN